MLYLDFIRVWFGMGPGPKIERSQLRLASLFEKFHIIVSDHFYLFLNATPKGWKESIGFPKTELYDKSFEKRSFKKIKCSRTSRNCYWRVFFFYLFDWLKTKYFLRLPKKNPYIVSATIALFWWSRRFIYFSFFILL